MKKIIFFLLLVPFIANGQTISVTTATDTICHGSATTFSAVASSTHSFHYRWKINTTAAGADSPMFTTSVLTNRDSVSCTITNTIGDTVYAISNRIHMTVQELPHAGIITGPDTVCKGTTITLDDTVGGGVWSVINPCASVSGGVVTGLRVMAGVDFFEFPAYDTVFYTMTNACGTDTASKPIVIHPQPNHTLFLYIPPNFVNSLCVGQSAMINAGAPFQGSAYSLHGFFTIDFAGENVIATHPGVDALIGVSSNYCGIDTVQWPVTVFDKPPAGLIISPPTICVGAKLLLVDSSYGYPRYWSASNGNATVDDTGELTGVRPGLDTIRLRLYNFCGPKDTFATIMVTPQATVSGANSICAGNAITLTSDYPGGTWSTDATGIAVVDQYGLVTGTNGGTANITYSVNSCTSTKTISVNPLPQITAANTLCVGSTAHLITDQAGGSWTSDNGTVASIDNTGQITGLSVGSALISYAAHTGCMQSKSILVQSAPLQVSGTTDICVGRHSLLQDVTGGGTWESSDPGVASINAAGDVLGNKEGKATISYKLSDGCASLANITVSKCDNTITVTPNPADGHVSITVDTNDYRSFVFINSIGQIWLQQPISLPVTDVDIQMFPPGVYFFRFSGPNRTQTIKLLKR